MNSKNDFDLGKTLIGIAFATAGAVSGVAVGYKVISDNGYLNAKVSKENGFEISTEKQNKIENKTEE